MTTSAFSASINQPVVDFNHPQIMRQCATCANWMQLTKAPHAGFCRIASAERTTHSGQSERFGLMTTDLQVCSQWMDAHPR